MSYIWQRAEQSLSFPLPEKALLDARSPGARSPEKEGRMRLGRGSKRKCVCVCMHVCTHKHTRENSLPIPRDPLWKYRWCKDTKRA